MYSPDRYVAALRFAAVRHASQVVPGSQLPYVVHVTSVASEVIAVLPQMPELDADLAVCAALLHDTIEDTATTYDELAAAFGARVADGVQALSKSNNDELTKLERMRDSLRRIKLQPREIWIVKLADRITNLAPPPAHWTTDKRRAYRDEAITIADELGSACAPLDARIRGRIAVYARHLA